MIHPAIAYAVGGIGALLIVLVLTLGYDVPEGYCHKDYNPRSTHCAP